MPHRRIFSMVALVFTGAFTLCLVQRINSFIIPSKVVRGAGVNIAQHQNQRRNFIETSLSFNLGSYHREDYSILNSSKKRRRMLPKIAMSSSGPSIPPSSTSSTTTTTTIEEITNQNQIEEEQRNSPVRNEESPSSSSMSLSLEQMLEEIEAQEQILINTIINYKKSQNNNDIKSDKSDYSNNNEIQPDQQDIVNNSNNNSINDNNKPSLDSFILLIENWLSFPKPDRAESIIDKMEEFYHVSGRIYERVINAWSFEATESGLRTRSSSSSSSSSSNDVEKGEDEMVISNDTMKIDPQNENEKIQIQQQQQKIMTEYGMNAARRAFNLLNRMEQLHEATGDLDFRPALSTYTSVINAIKRTTPTPPTSSPYNNQNKNANKINYEKEMKKATQMMNQLRNQRDRVYNQSDIDHMDMISPHQVFYVLKYLENGNEIMDRLKKKKVNGSVGVIGGGSSKKGSRNNEDNSTTAPTPTTTTTSVDNINFVPVLSRYNFNIVINELASLRKAWASQTAEEILDCMIHSHITYKYLKPNIESFNLCMNSWAQCTSRSDSAERAEGILKKLNTLQVSEGLLLDVTPDTVSYNSIVKAHANKGDAAKAEEVLNIMEDLYQSTKDEKISPDIISYSSVLNAYAKSAEYDQSAPKTAEKILMRMIKNQKEREGEDGFRPIVNVWSFNAVLNAYAAQGAGLRAMLLLQLMEDMAVRDRNEIIAPDTYSYNTVLKAIANSKEKGSVDKAMHILNQMVQMSANGNMKVKPDGVSYNTVILAIANHHNRGSGKAAERILQRMEKQYFSGDVSSKPTSTTYTSLIKAWTSDKGGTRRAEEIVSELKKSTTVKPDTSIYNALLNCYAKSGERNAARRAEEIIQDMLKEYSETGNESIKPNFRTYTTAIDIYSKSQEKSIEEKALGILTEMEKLYKEGEIHLRPNCYTYASVINCFARSNEGDKAVRSVSILEQMEEQYRSGNDSARPNIVVYNSVLNACAYTSREQEQNNIETAFKIACLVFDEVRSSDYVVPTHITYATFLQVCGNFMPESDIRDKLVEATFKRCAQEGLASKLVWRKLQIAASSTLLKSLQKSAEKENNEAKWSRNT